MIVARFASEAALAHARQAVARTDLGPAETYTPAPMTDMDGSSPLPLIILAGGIATGIASFLLQIYSAMAAYPFDIGGRPDFAWPSYVPTVFENAVLGAVIAGFFGYMIINRLPRLYDPVDDMPMMRDASRDGWMLLVRAADPDRLQRARALLMDLGAVGVEERAR